MYKANPSHGERKSQEDAARDRNLTWRCDGVDRTARQLKVGPLPSDFQDSGSDPLAGRWCECWYVLRSGELWTHNAGEKTQVQRSHATDSLWMQAQHRHTCGDSTWLRGGLGLAGGVCGLRAVTAKEFRGSFWDYDNSKIKQWWLLISEYTKNDWLVYFEWVSYNSKKLYLKGNFGEIT